MQQVQYSKIPQVVVYDDPSAQNSDVKSNDAEQAAYKRIIIVTLTMFMGYAVLVSFQGHLKEALNIPEQKTDPRNKAYTVAVSFLYIGNLVFRLAHNFVFVCFKPRTRVYISMGAMCTSMAVITFGVFYFKFTETLACVYIAYGLGGVGIGSFESNLLSSITPLGHQTKMWAIVGFPVGFACITVGGFLLVAAGMAPMYVYTIVFAGLLVGMLTFYFTVPVTHIKNNSDSLRAFVENVQEFRSWLPQIALPAVCLMVDMFNVSVFSSVMLYVFNGPKVPLFGDGSSGPLIPTDLYLAVYNLFFLLGDAGGRKLIYWLSKPLYPPALLLFAVLGAALCVTKLGIIVPLGGFFIMLANGTVYASASKAIDTSVDKRFNLVALSMWLFVGDIGSVTGSNLVHIIRDWLCEEPGQYICISS